MQDAVVRGLWLRGLRNRLRGDLQLKSPFPQPAILLSVSRVEFCLMRWKFLGSQNASKLSV